MIFLLWLVSKISNLWELLEMMKTIMIRKLRYVNNNFVPWRKTNYCCTNYYNWQLESKQCMVDFQLENRGSTKTTTKNVIMIYYLFKPILVKTLLLFYTNFLIVMIKKFDSENIHKCSYLIKSVTNKYSFMKN